MSASDRKFLIVNTNCKSFSHTLCRTLQKVINCANFVLRNFPLPVETLELLMRPVDLGSVKNTIKFTCCIFFQGFFIKDNKYYDKINFITIFQQFLFEFQIAFVMILQSLIP